MLRTKWPPPQEVLRLSAEDVLQIHQWKCTLEENSVVKIWNKRWVWEGQRSGALEADKTRFWILSGSVLTVFQSFNFFLINKIKLLTFTQSTFIKSSFLSSDVWNRMRGQNTTSFRSEDLKVIPFLRGCGEHPVGFVRKAAVVGARIMCEKCSSEPTAELGQVT